MKAPERAAGPWLPVLALLLNAFTWGVSWWPFRWLEARGLHALWATALIYAAAVLVIVLWRPGAPGILWRSRRLWWLVLAAGTTNATFNWAVTIGDVVRVVLLFYLMPLWAVLLARLLLGERLTPQAGLRVLLALSGALIVLWPAEGGWPVPRSLADGLGILGGFSFALNNVLLRREAAAPEEARALAMFFGGIAVSLLIAAALWTLGTIPAPPPPDREWLPAALLLALAFLLGNLALQYGAARLPANTTAAVMVAEVLFASVSAVLLGAGLVTWPLVIGGSLIVAAAVLSAWKA
ncbi:MAG: DMT family transporter [Rubrivivax sp.]|nr:DMT family transporter [Rubrivivax sp.]